MKKSLKRITTTLAACILAVAPVNSMANVNAATPETNTYRVYVDTVIDAPREDIVINCTFSTYKNIKHCGGRKAVNGAIDFYSNGSGTQTLTHSFFEYSGNVYKDKSLFNFTFTISSNDTDNVYNLVNNRGRGKYPQLNRSTSRPCGAYNTDIILVGDVDGDGIVNQNDITKLDPMINNYKTIYIGDDIVTRQKRAADINNDGFIDYKDADLLRSYVKGDRADFSDSDFTRDK